MSTLGRDAVGVVALSHKRAKLREVRSILDRIVQSSGDHYARNQAHALRTVMSEIEEDLLRLDNLLIRSAQRVA